MSTSTLVNGQPAELGCYVDGHWGQYGPDHLADQASAFGWEPAMCLDDPREVRKIIDCIEGWGYPRDGTDYASEGVGIVGGFWEIHAETSLVIEEWLNQHTVPGHIWHWHDGEFFLSSICDDPDDCTDDTCAHWE